MDRSRAQRNSGGAGILPVLLVIASAMVATGEARAIDDLSLNVAAGAENVFPGDTVTVTLDVANLSAAINGVQVLLLYDTGLLTLNAITPTDLGLIPPAAGWVEVSMSDAGGTVNWASIINGGSVSADHTVATLTFTAIDEGVTNIMFRPDVPPFQTKLTASDNSTIFPTTTDSGSITIQCDDGLFCNGVETFDGFACQPGTDPCDDSVGCTDDTCDELADSCTNAVNDANCDDGFFCNGGETCDAVLDCQPGVNPCDDSVACTDDICDELNDICSNTPNDANCDDGAFCNGAETCDAVLDCQASTFPCDDGVVCTDDTCDEIADTCINTSNDANCDDGVFCNGPETCDAVLDCQASTFPCDDGVVCTDDTCDELGDACINTPNDATCDDGVFCNGPETCDAVLDCQASVFPCDDAVACTIDTCDDLADVCINTPDDTFCDNGLFCDGPETCDPLLDCQLSTDPCVPLVCDEANDLCLSPVHIDFVDLYYAGRFGDVLDPSRQVLAVGSMATTANVTNHMDGITGIRVTFDNLVTFATTADAAFTFEWTTGTGIVFSPVTDVATMITVTDSAPGGVTVVDIVIANDHIRRRWLKVTINATQLTSSGVELDGELTGNPLTLPSGNGTPGGDAVFYVGNVTGDVDGDGKTTLTDIGLVRANVNPFVSVPITSLFDVDKDGKVQLTDVGAARADVNPFFTLPLIFP